jgi:NAD-dependent SIR2 family protein deacetylase
VNAALERMIALVAGRRVVALTGAGCSTESGIPDYRGAGTPSPARKPIQHDAFLRRTEVRQRYWARATVGWARFSRARPNAAHHALAELEQAGVVAGVITQNVDRLHQQAGSRQVVELHGALAEVDCLDCGASEPRGELQDRLVAVNPGWLNRASVLAPDGDADLPQTEVASFEVVGCRSCGGTLKPAVVFFGGSVAEQTLARAWHLFEEASVLLVVGSSLAVYSGFRFARRASERGMPIAVVNLGPTRADDLAQVRIEERAGDVLPRLAARLLEPQVAVADHTPEV